MFSKDDNRIYFLTAADSCRYQKADPCTRVLGENFPHNLLCFPGSIRVLTKSVKILLSLQVCLSCGAGLWAVGHSFLCSNHFQHGDLYKKTTAFSKIKWNTENRKPLSGAESYVIGTRHGKELLDIHATRRKEPDHHYS